MFFILICFQGNLLSKLLKKRIEKAEQELSDAIHGLSEEEKIFNNLEERIKAAKNVHMRSIVKLSKMSGMSPDEISSGISKRFNSDVEDELKKMKERKSNKEKEND